MSSRWASLCTVLAGLAVCGCGNYSNDDLDFQLALPEQSDMEAKMQLAIMRTDSAEYYQATRHAVTTFNNMVAELAGLIDLVRGNVPTSRNGDERTWGPWSLEDQPGWQIRVVMRRSTVSTTLLRMDYSVDVSPFGADDSGWVPFLAGMYVSSGSARTGQGEIHLLVSKAREAGYPVDQDPGLADLVRIDMAYDNADFPFSVSLYVEKLATASTKSGQLDYLQNQDGSGRLTFDWEGQTDTGDPLAARMVSQWIGSGAGRADLTADLTPNREGVVTTLGIECWGVDSVATYSYRIGNSPLGDPVSCLF
ncbi:MAG: hypothetical protein JXP73_12465 [Deltaproteobacteria bacterium]|jgi:hypothetical protein|nr:hypothetical protein [Deltaproteobacteria bacterium]